MDESRRTIVGTGDVLVARKPFQVFSLGRPRPSTAPATRSRPASRAQTLDQKPVEGKGELTLFKISYNAKSQPVGEGGRNLEVGHRRRRVRPPKSQGGQGRTIPDLIQVDRRQEPHHRGRLSSSWCAATASSARISASTTWSWSPTSASMLPGDKVKLLVNTNRSRQHRAAVRPPDRRRLFAARSWSGSRARASRKRSPSCREICQTSSSKRVTVADGRVHTEAREVIVPPEKRVSMSRCCRRSGISARPESDREVQADRRRGKPFVGSTAVTVYDKASSTSRAARMCRKSRVLLELAAAPFSAAPNRA